MQNVVQAPKRKTWNWTLATPTGSVAAAVSVTLPLTRVPDAGVVTEVTGPSVSTRRLVWTAEPSVLPARSVMTARKS